MPARADPSLIAEKRSQIRKSRDDMLSWYKGISKDKFGRNLEPMGPPGIEHEALTKMQDKMLSLEVNHRGLEAIAPDIDKQTVYVLREMADAASSLLADTRTFFDLFDSFARDGPETGIDKMNQGTKRKWYVSRLQDFVEHLSSVARQTAHVYVSHGKIQNAITMMKLQRKIAKKHAAFSKDIRPREMQSLIRNMEKLDSIMFDTQGAMEDLQDEIRKVQLPKGEIYPLMSTTYGDGKTDKLYFMIIIKYLDVMAHMHKLDDYLQSIIKGVDKIVDKTSLSSQMARDSPLERVKRAGSYFGFTAPEEYEFYPRKVYSQIIATYAHINNKASMFREYELVDLDENRFSGHYRGTDMMIRFNKEIRQNIEDALRKAQ